MSCDICYEQNSLDILPCCIGKKWCTKCQTKYKPNSCPFCRRTLFKLSAIRILPLKQSIQVNGYVSELMFHCQNYNVVKISC